MGNNLWRLDLLEVEYLKTTPRYSRTRLLLKSKNRSSLLPKSKDQALNEINALRQDIFNKKIHSSLIKYKRCLKKIIKSPSKNLQKEELNFIKSLDVEKIVNIKIIKIVQKIFRLIPSLLQNEPNSKPNYIPDWIIDGLINKKSTHNQSNFYNSLSKDEKNYYSKLMNNKELLNIVKIIENSFKIVLGPVKNEGKKDIEDVSSSESESEDEDEKETVEKVKETEEVSDEELDEDFSKYDALVAGSEDEDDVELDNTVNYNEVTDTEPSESEDESEDEFLETPKEHNLPELATGYFSGGSDSEIEDDEVVTKIIKPQKKNRRGQRARQKIWEAKFKNQANHIKKEKELKQKQYEQRQKEYEERVAKREARAKEWEKTGANNAPLKQQRIFKKNVTMPSAPTSTKEEPKETKLHPSWEAKKKQEAALKNVKFQGKKITF